MNKLSPYEQLIADKIQQLPVPDMSHSIWSQVEQALDAGAGTDPGPSQNPGASSYPGNAHYFYIAGCVIIGIIIAVLWGTKRSKKTPKLQPPAIEQKQTENVQPKLVLSPVEELVLLQLHEPVHRDELVRSINLPTNEASQLLMMMELQGHIKSDQNIYRDNR
mgnify:CR=1 FL=1